MSLMQKYSILGVFCAILMLFNGVSDAQWDKLSPNERLLTVGFSGIDGTTAVSGTTVIPTKYGWIGGHINQLALENTIEEQLLKGHIQSGFEVSGVNIEAFLTAERNHAKGVALQSQIGLIAFGNVHKTDALTVTVGGGNALENEQVREDLGLDPARYDEDTITPRIIAYAAADFGALQFLLRATPQWQLEDIQAEATGSYEFELGEKVSIELRASFGYDSHPVIEGETITRTYTTLANIEF